MTRFCCFRAGFLADVVGSSGSSSSSFELGSSTVLFKDFGAARLRDFLGVITNDDSGSVSVALRVVRFFGFSNGVRATDRLLGSNLTKLLRDFTFVNASAFPFGSIFENIERHFVKSISSS